MISEVGGRIPPTTGFYLKHEKCLACGFYFVVSFTLAVKKRIIRFFKDIFGQLTRSNFDKVQFEIIPLYSKCWYQAEIITRQNLNYLWPLFQSESWCSSFLMTISYHSHANKLIFICLRMNTSTRFEKEAKDSSERAYSLHFISNPWNFHTLPGVDKTWPRPLWRLCELPHSTI